MNPRSPISVPRCPSPEVWCRITARLGVSSMWQKLLMGWPLRVQNRTSSGDSPGISHGSAT